MAGLEQLAGLVLHAGDDLAAAARRSRFRVDGLPRRDSGPGWLRDLADDLRAVDWRQWRLRERIVTGAEHDTGQMLRIRFVGALRAVDFVSKAILGGSGDICAGPGRTDRSATDILVSDHPFAARRERASAPIRVPQWVRQFLPMQGDWEASVAALPRRRRKEIGRLLRRYGYRVRIEHGPEAVSAYYRDLHVPHVARRFGDQALRHDMRLFVSLHARCSRLDLLHDGTVVAASLLEQQSDMLAIKRHALRPGHESLPGRSDVLDYFSMLVAHLTGARTLDFGLSRPDLDDGVFRYKAKWGCHVAPVDGLKADVCIIPQRSGEACLAFLRRNHLLQRSRNGLVVRLARGGDDEHERLASAHRLADIPGIAGVEWAP